MKIEIEIDYKVLSLCWAICIIFTIIMSFLISNKMLFWYSIYNVSITSSIYIIYDTHQKKKLRLKKESEDSKEKEEKDL